MLIHVITVRMMQVAIVKVIRVALVRDRRVAARRSMDVRVSFVLVAIRHLVLSGWRLVPLCLLRAAGCKPDRTDPDQPVSPPGSTVRPVRASSRSRRPGGF